jgi:hypothetical protein
MVLHCYYKSPKPSVFFNYERKNTVVSKFAIVHNYLVANRRGQHCETFSQLAAPLSPRQAPPQQLLIALFVPSHPISLSGQGSRGWPWSSRLNELYFVSREVIRLNQ